MRFVLLFLLMPLLPSSGYGAGVSVSTPGPTVDVVWPHAESNWPFLKRSFTFGNTIPGSTLTINGVPAVVNANGSFFEMVRFSSGAFPSSFAQGK